MEDEYKVVRFNEYAPIFKQDIERFLKLKNYFSSDNKDILEWLDYFKNEFTKKNNKDEYTFKLHGNDLYILDEIKKHISYLDDGSKYILNALVNQIRYNHMFNLDMSYKELEEKVNWIYKKTLELNNKYVLKYTFTSIDGCYHSSEVNTNLYNYPDKDDFIITYDYISNIIHILNYKDKMFIISFIENEERKSVQLPKYSFDFSINEVEKKMIEEYEKNFNTNYNEEIDYRYRKLEEEKFFIKNMENMKRDFTLLKYWEEMNKNEKN